MNIYFWLPWVFVAVRAFLWLWQVGAALCCSAWASHWSCLSCCWAWGPGCVVAARRLSSWAPGLTSFVARGIFPDQGLMPCALHWQLDSCPPCHQGSPQNAFILTSLPGQEINSISLSYFSSVLSFNYFIILSPQSSLSTCLLVRHHRWTFSKFFCVCKNGSSGLATWLQH